MGYQALYRVWRPQQFSDMAGQEHITQTLQNALIKEKFSHAYLFNGPRGTGKTTIAKIIAKAVNCEKAPTREPCNVCSSCLAITNGSATDVMEIDAASNNGVDEIREIRENVKYAPSASRYKVYIIDEVHMLSQGAFNALLKTLEEPPKHVLFILATTEPHKIPLTIISRCQRFDFKRIQTGAIIKRLKHVAEKQGIEAADDALTLIAKAADGGMRDALSILDQAVAYSSDEVSVNDVLEITGMVSEGLLSTTIRSLFDRDATKAVQAINDLIDRGKDPGKFIEDLIFYCRDLLLYQTSPDLEDIRDRAQRDEDFEALTKAVDTEALYQYIHQLSETQHEMKYTSHPRVFLEVAMVKLCRPTPSTPNKQQQQLQQQLQQPSEELMKRIEVLEERLHRIEAAPTVESHSSVSQSKDTRKRKPSNGKALKLPIGEMKTVLSEATKPELKELRGSWADVMEKVRQTRIAAHAWLLESKPVASSNTAFLQAFKYDFHCQMVLENNSNVLQMVEDILYDVTGKRKKMLPIPTENWEALRASFIKEKDNEEGPGGTPETEAEDLLVTEAEKLVGPDLLEIKE